MAEQSTIYDLSHYIIDIVSIDATFSDFTVKLGNLQYVMEKDKISFDADSILYVNKDTTFQPIVRWLYNLNRETTLNRLALLFEDYNKLLHMVKLIIKNNSLLRTETLDVYYRIRDFNKKIMPGLDNLYKTYTGDQVYTGLLKELITKLCNFQKCDLT